MQPTRRQFLGATAATTVGLSTLLSGSATAQVDTAEWEYKPDHVTLSFDQTELEAYQPKFETSRDARRKMVDLYGFKAESSEWDVDVYAYWLRYNFQNSATDSLGTLSSLLSFGGPDSHFRDHEPSYIFVDPEGTPDKAVVTGYHHYALDIPFDDALWTEDRLAGTRSHVHLNVVDPWHHYKSVPPPADESTATLLESTVDLENWLEARDPWVDNGFYANSHAPAIENPFVMYNDRDTWWADGTVDKQLAPLWITLGLGGARDSDDLRVED
jgi:hypothetical protein